MSAYEAKTPLVAARQDKVQTLVVPFTITGSATSANVAITCDEPGFVFLATQGNDQITSELDSGETATYTTAANDSSGIFQMLIKVSESITKVVGASVNKRNAAEVAPAFLGSATGITTGAAGGHSIMIVVDSATALNAANVLDASLVLHYSTKK